MTFSLFQKSLLIGISNICCCFAVTNFGSKNSSIVIDDTSAMQINTPGQMIVNGGSIENTGLGLLTGKPIRFHSGSYTFFNSQSNVESTVLPVANSGGIVQLAADPTDPSIDGGTMISNPGGLTGVQIQAFPGNNILRGQPLFFGQNDLTLADQTTLLAIAVQNTVNTDITLNGGVLRLQDDLRLGDNAKIVDSGHVLFNSRRLSLGGNAADWNGTILWDSAQDIQLNSQITLNGNWLFLGEGQINGNGNVIDTKNGGSIIVLEGSTLRLSGVQIKGIGGGGQIKLAQDAELILTDVVLEMENSYAIDSGTIRVEGNSTVITGSNTLFFTDGPGGSVGKLIVDRVALTYDTLAYIDSLNIQPQLIQDPERKHIDIIGGGTIGTFRRDVVTFQSYSGDSTALIQKYAIVAPYRTFKVFPTVNPDESLNYDVLLNGNTNFIGFTFTEDGIFILTPGVQATTKNLVLRDFSPNHVVFQSSEELGGSSLLFGDKTMVSLARNETLNYVWKFSGNTILKGGGNILELGPNGAIEVQGANSQLLLDGIIIRGIRGTNIRCLDDSSKITLKNVKWFQNGSMEYQHGAIDILDDTMMIGGINPLDGAESNFIYRSTQPFTVLAHSMLTLSLNMHFTYNPADGNMSLFRFVDRTSVLFMNQAFLDASFGIGVLQGMLLTNGRFMVRDKNAIAGNIDYSQMFLDIGTGATFN